MFDKIQIRKILIEIGLKNYCLLFRQLIITGSHFVKVMLLRKSIVILLMIKIVKFTDVNGKLFIGEWEHRLQVLNRKSIIHRIAGY